MNRRDDRSATILYVDDEEMACKYFMRSAGSEYDVLTANGADSAIAILRAERGRIGVIVTDYRMPVRDGGDLLRQIEREYPHVVRILITAYADKTLLIDTVNSGEVFRILEKPLDMIEVRRALRMACDLARERVTNRQRLAAINETLAFLAHELNTPLATIVNFSRGIEQRVADSDRPPGCKDEAGQITVGRAAHSINENARYCLSVLSSFVDSVRNAGLNFLGEGDSAASQLVMSLLDTYPMSVEQRAIVQVDLRQDFRISAMPNCVALVLSSLLANAFRALEGHSDPRLQIVVRVEADPQILVSDNGPGIAPAILERLMVDPVTTHAAAGGSGRGMIFCNRIMQSFGGGLKVESETDRSTTITLSFPALKNLLKRSAR